MGKYFAVISLFLLILMVITRVVILNKKEGIKAFVFAKTDKKDIILVPFVLLLLYQILANAFSWPKIYGISLYLFHNTIINTIGIVFCSLSLIIFLISLVSFGKSFRVGVDTEKPNKLVTDGIFAYSRNPIYAAFGFELFGLFLIIPTILSLFFFIAGILLFHRQVLIEEDFLKKHYGEEYEEYCKKVRRYF